MFYKKNKTRLIAKKFDCIPMTIFSYKTRYSIFQYKVFIVFLVSVSKAVLNTIIY